ncbi:hypothetical protein BJF95_22765 [Rhizobium oryziradicis]|uniref:Uncharacterized protein n=1 Tax=Rhizobium oryziradicis TaxID=1867956 RepID=A0A1Q8ZPM3_9HYPH|nr:hypothetical protein BJF95_22765 [Rhizobium oryziradicis]
MPRLCAFAALHGRLARATSGSLVVFRIGFDADVWPQATASRPAPKCIAGENGAACINVAVCFM